MTIFPKPKDIKHVIPFMKVFPDGREILNVRVKAGLDEYIRRKLEMWDRQGRRCALQMTEICKQRQGRWPQDEITFDHFNGRSAGKHDDRIYLLDPKTGKMVWSNSSVCSWCNCARGSRRIPYIIDAP
jgi:hypothetical protein